MKFLFLSNRNKREFKPRNNIMFHLNYQVIQNTLCKDTIISGEEKPPTKQNGNVNAEVKSPSSSVPQSPTSSTTSTASTSMANVAGTARRLQRNYSKSGRQKSQACVLQ